MDISLNDSSSAMFSDIDLIYNIESDFKYIEQRIFYQCSYRYDVV